MSPSHWLTRIHTQAMSIVNPNDVASMTIEHVEEQLIVGLYRSSMALLRRGQWHRTDEPWRNAVLLLCMAENPIENYNEEAYDLRQYAHEQGWTNHDLLQVIELYRHRQHCLSNIPHLFGQRESEWVSYRSELKVQGSYKKPVELWMLLSPEEATRWKMAKDLGLPFITLMEPVVGDLGLNTAPEIGATPW